MLLVFFCKLREEIIKINSKSLKLKNLGLVREAHRCTIFLCYLGCDDQYRNPNINDRDHLVGQITKWEVAKKKYVDD